ncbi:MAG: aminoglycoside phosphotransferase [Bacteroidetes bacterium]|nr:MAG: aminoglycoside phosphotransferase [Bacteroidota bacterium]
MKFVLHQNELPALQQHLRQKGWLQTGEQLQAASIPGAGNMNYTLRIHTNQRTFILKQARDYVEKYPQIPAPAERARIEGQYYRLIEQDAALAACSPALLGVDEANCLLMLEDLGTSSDYTFLYRKGETLGWEDLQALLEYAMQLHGRFKADVQPVSITNRKMRALNAEHIFHYPFLEENGFDLDTVLPGLQQLAMPYKQDTRLKAAVQALSKHYLEDGPSLLHGDYYPGSWLKTARGIMVIDPEFCFFGPPEFDLSVLLAHLKMAQQPAESLQHVLSYYHLPLQQDLLHALTGVEIMRRIIGLAQLPLDLSLEERGGLLAEARQLILG